MSHFDLVVLGAGPGGYVAAIRAAQLGKSVAVVEKQYWGGVCLNVGCIPSKALLRNAELSHILTHEKDIFGITGDASMDYAPTHARSREVSDSIVKGVHFLMKKNKITEIDGWGTLHRRQDASTSTSRTADPHEVTGDNLIIATGATTRLVPGTELSENVVTYEEQILDDELPGVHRDRRLRCDRRGVRLRDDELRRRRDDRGVPRPDGADRGRRGVQGAAQALQEARRRRSCSPPRSRRSRTPATRSQVTVAKEAATRRSSRPRRCSRPSASRRGWRATASTKTGVETSDRGAIVVDARGRTNVDGVYAIGDVTGKLMLAHTAEAMGIVAAETIAGEETIEIDFDMIPRATYCQPQIASFGYSEEQAKEKGYDVKVGEVPVLRQRQGQGPRRHQRLRQDRRRREVQRDHRRPPDRPRRHRAAPGAHPGPEVGPHRRRGRPQRLRPPDALRGGQGGRRGHRRPHDPPVTP